MFSTLLASRVRRQKLTLQLATSMVLHLGIVGAVLQTVEEPAEPPVMIDTLIIYDRPAPRRPAEATHPLGTVVPARPTIPEIVHQPLELPAPEIELGKLPRPEVSDFLDSDTDRGTVDAPTGGGTSTGRLILSANDVDEPPRLISQVTPRYPPALEAAGIEGGVTLQFVVDTLGSVDHGSIVVINSSNPAFADAAKEAVRSGARYSPGQRNGRAMFTLVKQTFRFDAP